ncbi:MAG: iron ABC transporter permease [Treponema sp.]|jgi:iron complex transport system permease protein|nr:iron ABC transporter permease [Treponema sp.]
MNRSAVCLSILGVVFALCFVASFMIGKFSIPPVELLRILFTRLTGGAQDWSPQIHAVIFHVRLPRVCAAVLVGAGLSAAGASYQGLFNNPLVSPDVLGASAGAAFGAALAIIRGASYAGVSLSAFVFGIAAVLAAALVSFRARANPTLALVLAGIMFSSLFSSATSFLKLIADTTNQLPAITYWLMGSLAGIRERDLLFAAVPVAAGLIVLFLFRWQLNLITMGEDEARSLGVNTRLVRCMVTGGATLITAACVSVSGMIGWVGLVVPHFARMLAGFDNRTLLPASMLLGASYLLMVDNAARTLSTTEIPIGILTAFIGAPFFVYLILNRGNRG